MIDKEKYIEDDVSIKSDDREDENENVLNAAYDKVSGNGRMPSLEDFLGSDFETGDDDSLGSGIGPVLGDPVFSSEAIEEDSSNIDGEEHEIDSNAEDDLRNVKFNLKNVLNGTYFKSDNFAKQVPYFGFLILLAVAYITNRNYAESLIRDEIELKRTVRELRAESITFTARLMNISKETEVLRRVTQKKIGLKELKVPPLKFYIDKFEREDSLVQEKSFNERIKVDESANYEIDYEKH